MLSSIKTKILSQNQVHVWCVNFDVSEKRLNHLNALLSEDEIVKASKFHFKKDKNCSIITRGTLRLLSSKYLNIKPEDIPFKNGEFGKPYYDLKTKLKFNVSHSGNMAVIGFVLNDDIGVDIEEMKTDFEVLISLQITFQIPKLIP
jgi:4'-phosphopantetheinyl transferase